MTNDLRVGQQTKFTDILKYNADNTTDFNKNKSLRLGGKNGGKFLYSKTSRKPSRMWLSAIFDRIAKRTSAAKFVRKSIDREYGHGVADQVFKKLKLSNRVRRSDLTKIHDELKNRKGQNPGRTARIAARDFLDAIHNSFIPNKNIKTKEDLKRYERATHNDLFLQKESGDYTAGLVLHDVLLELEGWLSSEEGVKADRKTIRNKFESRLRTFGDTGGWLEDSGPRLKKKTVRNLMKGFDQAQRRMLTYDKNRLDRREKLLDAKGLGRDNPIGDMARGPGLPQNSMHQAFQGSGQSNKPTPKQASETVFKMPAEPSKTDQNKADPSTSTNDNNEIKRKPSIDPYEMTITETEFSGFDAEQMRALVENDKKHDEMDQDNDDPVKNTERKSSVAGDLEQEAEALFNKTKLSTIDGKPKQKSYEVTLEIGDVQTKDGIIRFARVHRFLSTNDLDDDGNPPPLNPELRAHIMGRQIDTIEIHDYVTPPKMSNDLV